MTLAARVSALALCIVAAGCSGDPGSDGDGHGGAGGAGDLGLGGAGGNGGGSGGSGGSGGQPGTPDMPALGTIEYAPYFYTWGWDANDYAFGSLTEMKQQGGPDAITLAFVLAGNGCNASRGIPDHLDDVDAYRAAGGHVKASFGGASGTYLEYACKDANALAQAITAFVDETGITDLDFDIEQGSKSSNAALNALRGAALKKVQDARGIRVAFTLPVEADGMNELSRDIVAAAVAAGVRLSFVNLMVMDYYSKDADYGVTPEQSLDAAAGQVVALVPGVDRAAAYHMLGATAMIGLNDDDGVFSHDNARTLIQYARDKHLGLVSFWAIQRDQPCSGGGNDSCNGQNNDGYQFHEIFDRVNQS
jgi:chitinase